MTSVAKTYLPSSVIGAVFFFLPLGLVAVFFAFLARRRLENGDENGAARASRWARRFMTPTFAIGGIIYLLLTVSLLALGAFSR